MVIEPTRTRTGRSRRGPGCHVLAERHAPPSSTRWPSTGGPALVFPSDAPSTSGTLGAVDEAIDPAGLHCDAALADVRAATPRLPRESRAVRRSLAHDVVAQDLHADCRPDEALGILIDELDGTGELPGMTRKRTTWCRRSRIWLLDCGRPVERRPGVDDAISTKTRAAPTRTTDRTPRRRHRPAGAHAQRDVYVADLTAVENTDPADPERSKQTTYARGPREQPGDAERDGSFPPVARRPGTTRVPRIGARD